MNISGQMSLKYCNCSPFKSVSYVESVKILLSTKNRQTVCLVHSTSLKYLDQRESVLLKSILTSWEKRGSTHSLQG